MKYKEKWQRSTVSNLVKSRTSRVYFGRAMVGGVLKYKSLKTTDFKIAQIVLVRFMESIRRQRRVAKKKPLSIKFGSLLDVLSSEIRNSRESSPATIKSGIQSIKRLRNT